MLVREAEHRRSARPAGRTDVVGTLLVSATLPSSASRMSIISSRTDVEVAELRGGDGGPNPRVGGAGTGLSDRVFLGKGQGLPGRVVKGPRAERSKVPRLTMARAASTPRFDAALTLSLFKTGAAVRLASRMKGLGFSSDHRR